MTSRPKLPELKGFLELNQSKFKMDPKMPENAPSALRTLRPHQEELHQLGELAGIHMDAKVFRILIEFLNMGVDPTTIFTVLKSIRRSSTRHSRISLA